MDQADREHARVLEAIAELKAAGAGLRSEVRAAAGSSMQEALNNLQGDIAEARQVVKDLQRVSLWRSALQHVLVAGVAIVIALVAVAWYVPSMSDITALRQEREQLQGTVDTLAQRGGRMMVKECGPQKRLCVMVDRTAGAFGLAGNKGEVYMVAKGY